MSVLEFLDKFSQTKLQNIYNDEAAAFYLINKPKGQHSFKIISSLRQILGIKKIGFAGTLDPLASGLMIIATGSATKLLDLLHQLPKVYVADIIFGQTSASFDLEKEVIVNQAAREFTRTDLEKYLNNFLGKQAQTVPIFSAKKIAGQKLHQLARSGKSNVVLPKNKIEIYNLEIIDFSYPNLKLKISCSAGTYIRSLVSDLGNLAKTGAVLADLKRTKIGPWSVENSIVLADLNQEKIKQASIKAQLFIDECRAYQYQ